MIFHSYVSLPEGILGSPNLLNSLWVMVSFPIFKLLAPSIPAGTQVYQLKVIRVVAHDAAGAIPVKWFLGNQDMAGWWFGTCFFPYIGNNTPIWLIFFRGVGIPPTSYGFRYFWALTIAFPNDNNQIWMIFGYPNLGNLHRGYIWM